MAYSICVYCPLHLRLLCLGELSTPSASFVAHSVYVCCLCLFCIVWCFVYSVSICCTSISCLLHLRLLWLVPSVSVVYAVYACYALVSCLLCLHLPWLALSASAIFTICICCVLVSRLLYLCLPWLILSASAVCIVCVCYLYYLRLLCLGKLSTLSAFSVTCFVCICCLCLIRSVCICCISVSYLLHLHLLWLAPSIFAIYASSALSASAMPWSVVYSVCVFYSLLRQYLLFVPRSLYLRLLYYGELSAPFAFFVTCFVYVCYLCLVCSVCVLSFIIFVVNCIK